MITAAQARNNSSKHSLDGIEDIYNKINTESTDGRTSISWARPINDLVKAKLVELGFKVTYHDNYDSCDPRERPYWTISW